jgi:hypothetical protein
VLGSAALTAGAISADQFSGVLIAVVISIIGSSIMVRIVGTKETTTSEVN